jgi:hypothetical protein
MIYALQTFLEDYFYKQGLVDSDQYAVRVAKLYQVHRDPAALMKGLRKVRTTFFRRNPLNRHRFEKRLIGALQRIGGESKASLARQFPGGVDHERKALSRRPRRTIKRLLDLFRRATEARGVAGFWEARSRGKLHKRPEKTVAQALIGNFFYSMLDGRGVSVHEAASGIGFVDVTVILSGVPHLLELKVLRARFDGVSQLGKYMKTEGRREGWLMVFDARPTGRRTVLPTTVETENGGTVRVIVIDINPSAPSSR